MGDNKFFKGMLAGAVIGGLLTLLDRKTRARMKEIGREACETVSAAVKNPKETCERWREKIEQTKRSFEQLQEDLSFISEKAKEIRQAGSETGKLIGETAQVLRDKKEYDDEK